MRASRRKTTTPMPTRRARRRERARRRATWRFFAGICVVGALILAFSVVVTLTR
jgi:hypothetical protein